MILSPFLSETICCALKCAVTSNGPLPGVFEGVSGGLEFVCGRGWPAYGPWRINFVLNRLLQL